MGGMLYTLPTLIILTQREDQRLKSQAKRLPRLLSAMCDLLDRLAQSQPTEQAYEEMAFLIGIYQKGTWGFIRHFYGSVSSYVDRWLKVLSYKGVLYPSL